MSALETRIAKVEAAIAPSADDPFGLAYLTNEQVFMMLRDVAIAELSDRKCNFTDEQRGTLLSEIASIEDRVRRVGRSLAQYPAHWVWVENLWSNSRGRECGAWVPPVAENNGTGWTSFEPAELRSEMRWRRDVLARPDIVELLDEGRIEGELQREADARLDIKDPAPWTSSRNASAPVPVTLSSRLVPAIAPVVPPSVRPRLAEPAEPPMVSADASPDATMRRLLEWVEVRQTRRLDQAHENVVARFRREQSAWQP